MDSLSLYFMMPGNGFTLSLSPVTDESSTMFLQLASIFGDIEGNTLTLSNIQKASDEIKQKISAFVAYYGEAFPSLKKVEKQIKDLPEDMYFLILPSAPEETMSKLSLETFLDALNEAKDEEKARVLYEARMNEVGRFFENVLSSYEMILPRTDKRIYIGEADREKRVCRFCKRTMGDGVTFRKIAHAIPEGLGNKTIILNEECDTCNEYFGERTEPHLISHLNIVRVFSGVKGKKGLPTIKYKNGEMFNDGDMMVVKAQKIEELPGGGFKLGLETTSKFKPLNFYKSLCKIALSVLDADEIVHFEKTIRWLRYDENEGLPLPKVAATVAHPMFTRVPQVSVWVRKDDNFKAPHVVSEFRIGSFVYVFILPFSSRDELDFSEPDVYDGFWKFFTHYDQSKGWKFHDYSSPNEVVVNEVISMVQNERPNEIAQPEGQ